ncbi:6-phosphofructo-2-kinase/fructose-2,6-bisphosphatase-like isoform X2 [Papaver somniferum]|uniref:6-phosphofructo-2-kinase/fructose-2, 6-bisphosphatase-like isoform X2 n=1 Tax=Papaver somniferum TaxID=3469 RepID=UPI000E701737|nr:6-phosphofructo-2-kinase/fructose-2,6-bisphosphatase-like isoform X2 [Papaver somniferum]
MIKSNQLSGFILQVLNPLQIQWRALDEINAGVFDGMTNEEIKKNMPEGYESRKKDKLRYRYPQRESYLDVIQRLESGIIETERQRSPVVISHQVEYYFSYANLAKSSKLVASEDGSRSGVKIHSPTQVWKDCSFQYFISADFAMHKELALKAAILQRSLLLIYVGI